MIEDKLVVNDVELDKRYYHTTPKGGRIPVMLNNMCELLQMETKMPGV